MVGIALFSVVVRCSRFKLVVSEFLEHVMLDVSLLSYHRHETDDGMQHNSPH